MNLRKRLEDLEGRTNRAKPPPVSGLAAEVRELDREIVSLENQIAQAEEEATPEELAESRRDEEELEQRLCGYSLDEKILSLESEIALLEAEGEGTT